jgi:hypothetical protein
MPETLLVAEVDTDPVMAMFRLRAPETDYFCVVL